MSRFLASIAVLFLLEITASAQSVGNIVLTSRWKVETNSILRKGILWGTRWFLLGFRHPTSVDFATIADIA